MKKLKGLELIVNWLSKEGAISDDDKDIYLYALNCVLLNVAPIIIVIIIGIFIGNVVEGLVMIAPFIFIRKYSGGFHMQKMSACLITSVISLLLCMLGIKFLTCSAIIHVGVIIANCIITLLSPIDNENKKLSTKEKEKYRIIAILLTWLVAATYFWLYRSSYYNFAISIAIGIMLTAFLQLCEIINRLVKSSTKNPPNMQ